MNTGDPLHRDPYLTQIFDLAFNRGDTRIRDAAANKHGSARGENVSGLATNGRRCSTIPLHFGSGVSASPPTFVCRGRRLGELRRPALVHPINPAARRVARPKGQPALDPAILDRKIQADFVQN